MAAFRYVALDRSGREVRGNLDAPDARAVAGMLKERSLFVVSIDAAAEAFLGSSMAGRLAGRQRGAASRNTLGAVLPVRTRDRVVFLRQMALMLRSGLTLLQALDVAARQTSKKRLSDAIGRFGQDVRSGRSFAESMRGERGLFSKFVTNVVASAEASGDMDASLDRTAVYLERQAATRTKLLSSMFYPAFVVLAGIVVFVFLVGWVIPKFAKYLTQRGVALPWSTQVLIDVSQFLQSYGVVILGGIGAAVAGLVFMHVNPWGRQKLDRAVLRVPVIGGVLTVAAMAHASRSLSMLLNSGVTLLESLRITARIVNNRAISSRFTDAAERILKGDSLSQSLEHAVIPPMVNHVVAVGERVDGYELVDVDARSATLRKDGRSLVVRMKEDS
ncbi:MAG: type II secretion system F family protein [Myxococcales bacterium]|nr:type II secretion system F family protein [Myxococcales bacterium]